MPPIYLDNAASTRVSEDVIALMTEVMRTGFANPAGAHPAGAAARAHIETGRKRLLTALGDDATRGDIVWTSGCSESDALAVLGAARLREGKVVVSSIEHPAVGATAAQLPGNRVVEIAPGRDGVLDPDVVAAAARDAAVVAIVMVQNEIGVVQPIAQIAQAVRAANPAVHFHVDAAQAFGKMNLDVAALAADSIAIAGHKLGGPKGIGALWLKKDRRLEPLWVGGGHQRGLRGGTQDAPGAAGLGLAAERAMQLLPIARTGWLELAALAHEGLASTGVRQLVPDQRRSPHILALGFAGVPAAALRTVLSSRGVYISTGSSCASTEMKPSTVLAAIGLPEDVGMLRLSFAHDTTPAEVSAASAIISEVVTNLRGA
jgi:cysteine desulfurase